MICALCGELLLPGEAIYFGYLRVCRQDIYTGDIHFTPAIMEDGSEEKHMHLVCMVEKGYPLEVVGAGRLPDV